MRILICLLLFTALGAQSADAQRRRDRQRDGDRAGWWEGRGPVHFGVRAGNDFEEDAGSAGAQLRLPLARQLLLVPSGDVFFGDAPTEWQLNADLVVKPAALGGLYGGAGAAFASRDFDLDGDDGVEAGYNLVLGLGGGLLLDSRVQPFVEGRWTDIDDYQPFRLVIGIDVPVR